MKSKADRVLRIIAPIITYLLCAEVVLAATYTSTFTVNPTASYSMVGLYTSCNNTFLVSKGYTLPSTLDTRTLRSTTELPHMTADSMTLFAIPTVAGTSQTLQYTLGNPVLSSLKIIPGNGGNLTAVDAPNLEISDNGSAKHSGWMHTEADYLNRFLWRKNSGDSGWQGVDTHISNISEITANVTGGLLTWTSGNSDYVTIPDNDDFSFTTGGVDEPFSISVWMLWNDQNATMYLVNKNETAGNQREYALSIDNTDQLKFIMYKQDDSNIYIGRSTPAITAYDGLWISVIMTYDGSETSGGVNIYINGTEVDNADVELGAYAGMTAGTAPMYLGTSAAHAANYFDGFLRYLKIFDYELSEDEIADEQINPYLNDNAVGIYPIADGTGNPQDISGNEHNATANLADWSGDSASVTIVDIDTGEHSANTTVSDTFLGLGVDTTDDTALPNSTNLILNLPLHHVNMQGSPIISKDTNGVPFTVTGAVWGTYGRVFDGNDKLVYSTADWRGADNAGSFNFWFKGTSGTLFASADQASVTRYFQIYIRTASHNLAVSQRNADVEGLSYGGNTIDDDTWHFATLSSDGVNYNIYIDGISYAVSGTNDGDWLADTLARDNVTIGTMTRSTGDSSYLNGTIGDILYYSSSTTLAEHITLYNATKWRYDGSVTSYSNTHFTYNVLAGGIPDNDSDWVLMEDNTVPYADEISLTVDGAQQLLYCPTTMIIGTNLPDRGEDGTSNNGTFSWGSNPSTITVSALGSLAPEITPTIPDTTDIPPDVLPPWNPEIPDTPAAPTNPLTPMIAVFAALWELPEINVWFFLGIVFSVGAFFLIAATTRHVGWSLVAMCAVMCLFAVMNIFPEGLIYVSIIGGIGGLISELRQ